MPVCVSDDERRSGVSVCVRPTGPSRSPPLSSRPSWTNARDLPSPGAHERIDIQPCGLTEFLMQSSPGGHVTQYSLWFGELGQDHIYTPCTGLCKYILTFFQINYEICAEF